MEYIDKTAHFLKLIVVLTLNQLVAVFGVLFVFGLLLYLLARFTRVTFVKSLGQKADVYFTGWIGTPVHELGHAIFCIPFGHRITEIKLFSPNAKNGSLGYVNHSYKPHNIWHNIGNFFIGLGPIIFGSVVMFFLIKYLIPDNSIVLKLISSKQVLVGGTDLTKVVNSILETAGQFMSGLFSNQNINSWQFWVFIYLSLSISTHMELSPSDIRSMLTGLIAIIVLLLIINTIGLIFNLDISKNIGLISSYTILSIGLFTFITVCSTLFFVGSFLILNIFSIIRFRKFFHPFG